MTRYYVNYSRSQWSWWEVEADDETSAMAKAYNRLVAGEVAWDKSNAPKVSVMKNCEPGDV